jgi:hypothetical protein
LELTRPLPSVMNTIACHDRPEIIRRLHDDTEQMAAIVAPSSGGNP